MMVVNLVIISMSAQISIYSRASLGMATSSASRRTGNYYRGMCLDTCF